MSMMDRNSSSKPLFWSSEAAADPSKDQIAPSNMSFVRHTSSSSIISSRSFLSNATGSSTRTHRRSVMEVSSIFFSDSPARSYSERTTERTDTYTKKPPAASSRQVSYQSYEVHSTSEMRGPDSDQVLSRSSSSHVRVSSDDTFNSPGNAMPQKQGHFAGSEGEKHQADTVDILDLDPTLRAMELIRELSFEPPRAGSSYCSRRTPTPSLVKTSASRGSKKTSSSHEKLASSSNEGSQYGGTAREEPVEVEVEEYELPPPAPPTSPPLPPRINRLGSLDHMSAGDVMPQQIMHNRNRARSTSISEMSESYLMGLDDSSSKNSESHSICSSKNDEDEANEKKSLITIENNTTETRAPVLLPRPVTLFTRNRSRSASIASGQSSYVSSSSSDDLSTESGDESDRYSFEEETECQDYSVVKRLGDPSPNQETGHLSLQDGKCNAGDSGKEFSDQNVRQLNSDTLREWDMMCEEELSKKGIQNQFISRALSCPYKIASPERGGSFIMEQDEDESAEEPHLLASPLPPNGAISPSLFSYTNSARSTISSHKDPDEINSELAFDIDFIHSYSMEKSSVSGTPLDCVEQLNKCHRRCRSSGSRLGKPACLPKAVLSQEGGRLNKPCLSQKHRRFKSDGSIFCNRLGIPNPSLSQVNLNLTEAQSFKSKYSDRHQRGKSLDSFTGSQFFDCSPLQCILEEASKGSHSDDGFPILGLVDFLKQYLESLGPARVLELGFVLGLFVGWVISFVLKNMY